MDEREDRDLTRRIRERAYRLWQDEGSPEGRAETHWDMAAELVAIEDNHGAAMEPIPSPDDFGPSGEPIEPIEAVLNAGEFPTTTDQGEQIFPQRREPAKEAKATAADQGTKKAAEVAVGKKPEAAKSSIQSGGSKGDASVTPARAPKTTKPR